VKYKRFRGPGSKPLNNTTSLPLAHDHFLLHKTGKWFTWFIFSTKWRHWWTSIAFQTKRGSSQKQSPYATERRGNVWFLRINFVWRLLRSYTCGIRIRHQLDSLAPASSLAFSYGPGCRELLDHRLRPNTFNLDHNHLPLTMLSTVG